MSEVADTLAIVRDRVAVPIIVDADTGFGNALNLHRTVRVFERMGANAIQLEDQAMPKRCGHLAGKSLIPAAEMRGTDLRTGATGVSEALNLSGFTFEAEFRPAHAWLDPASPTAIVVDWRPVVRAQLDAAGNVTYTLDDEVHAFVVGSNPAGAPGGQGPRPLRDLEAHIAATDCGGRTITVTHGRVPITVSFTAQTQFVDHDRQPLPGGCADLNVGDKVEVDGQLQPGNVVLATTVRDKSVGGHAHGGGHNGGGHNGGGHNGGGSQSGAAFERAGVVDNAQVGPTPSFELRVGGIVIAEITTDANTRYSFDDHHAMHGQVVDPAQDIYDGVFLKVEGSIVGTSAANVPIVLADEIEIK